MQITDIKEGRWFELYKDRKREWRWRLKAKFAGKTNIIATSSEGYVNRKDCVRMVQSMRKLQGIPIFDTRQNMEIL